jgi:hypothetical protein
MAVTKGLRPGEGHIGNSKPISGDIDGKPGSARPRGTEFSGGPVRSRVTVVAPAKPRSVFWPEI